MKWYFKFSIVLLIACLAYLIGNWIPIDYLKPQIVITDLKTPEYYNLIIGIISGIVTFFAVIVALFKEDIRQLWVYSKFEANFEDDNKLSEKLKAEKRETSSESGTNHYEAEKYELIVIVENKGNMTAKNCEIYLDKLQFSGEEFPEKQNIKITNSSLDWNGENEKKLIIPPKGKKSIMLIELVEPENQSSPSGESRHKQSELYIGGVYNPKEFKKGKWEASFILYSDDSKPYYFVLELDWNGKWEQRFSEMKKCLKINLKN